MEKAEAAAYLAGAKQVEGAEASAPTNLHVISGEVVEKSENGKVKVDLGGLVFNGDDEQAVEIDTLGGLEVGDTATILLTGQENRGMTPLGVGGVGTTDRISQRVSSIEADYVKADILEANYAHITDGVIDNAKIDHADVNNLNANYAHISSGVIDNAQINGADIVNGTITGTKIAQASITGSNIDASTFTNGQISGSAIDSSTLTNIPYAEIDALKAKNISANDIEAAHAYVDALTTNNVTAQNIVADHATVGSLSTNYAHITNGVIDNATISYADVDNLSANYAQIQNGKINSALIDTAAIVDEQVFTVTGNKATLASIDASKINVTNLNADNITVNKINGQTVTGKSISDALSQHETDISTKVDTTTFNNTVEGLNDRIDGAIETFTGTVVPTLNNTPASAWNTTELRDEHVGDVYYVVNASSQQNGYCYRFTKSGSTYSWQLIKDSDVTAALSRLQTAEGKITTFDSDISTLKTDTGELKTKTQSLETSLGDKVDVTTFNDLSSDVEENSATITTLSNTVSQKADSSTVTTLSNTVNQVKQTADTNKTSITNLTQTVNQKADSSTVTTLTQRTSTIEQNLNGITTRVGKTESTLETVSNPNLAPYFSMPIDDVYDATSNPDGYWKRVTTDAQFTTYDMQVEHNGSSGWAHFSGTATSSNPYVRFEPLPIATLKPSTKYTFVVEADVITANVTNINIQLTGGQSQTDTKDQFATAFLEQYIKDTGIFYKEATTVSDFSSATGLSRSYFQIYGTGAFDAYVRISLFEGEYKGQYKPYVDQTLSARVKSAETSIVQNAEAISLNARSTESLMTFVPTKHPRTDTDFWYTAPSSYWVTLDDGWYHLNDYTAGTSAASFYIAPKNWGQVIPGEKYTFLIEIRNYTSTDMPTSGNLGYMQEMGGAQFWGNAVVKANGTNQTTYIKYEDLVDGAFTKRFVKLANEELEGANLGMCFRYRLYGASSRTTSFDIRISVYPGDYEGPYNEYLTATSSAQLMVANDEIDARVEKSGVIAAINASVEEEGGSTVKIIADKVNIEGAAIFTSGRLSSTSLDNAYDAKGAASTVQTNLDNLQVGGRNLLPDSKPSAENLPKVSMANATNTFVTEDGFACYKGTGAGTSIAFYASIAKFTVALEANTQYTYSAWIKVTTTTSTTSLPFSFTSLGHFTVRNDNSTASDKTHEDVAAKRIYSPSTVTVGQWTKIVLTFTTNALSGSYFGAYSKYNYGTDYTLFIRDMKLEKGNKATDWTPAPEDVEANTLASGIEYIEGTQTAATNLWTGVTKETALVEGKTIAYKLPYAGNSTAATLNLTLAGGGTTGAKAVQMLMSTSSNTGAWTNITTHWPVGSIIPMTYDGTKWCVQNYNTNVNQIERTQHSNTCMAASANATGKSYAVASSSVIGYVKSLGGYQTIVSGTTIDLSYPILWGTGNVAASKTFTNAYEIYPSCTLRTNIASWTGTQYAMAYLVGTILGNLFTVDSAVFTSTEPTNEDGKFYIPIGQLYSTYQIAFRTTKDLYAYLDGKFRQVTPTEIVASQKIYYRSKVSGTVPKPTEWVTQTANKYNDTVSVGNSGWSTKVTPIAANKNDGTDKYLYLYTCEQRKRLDGTVECTAVTLDENTTVIDGGNIITHSITAESIEANSLTLGQISTTTQADILNSKVVVGGRNLLRRTASSFTYAINTTSYGTHHLYSTGTTDTAYDGPKLAELGLAVDDEVTLSFDWSTSANGSNAIRYGTFRAEMYGVKADGTNGYTTMFGSVVTMSATNNAGHYSQKVKLTSLTVNTLRMVLRVDNSCLTFAVSNVKLEKGNKESSWSPAPEDMATNISVNAVTEQLIDVSTSARDASEKANNLERDLSQVQSDVESFAGRISGLEGTTHWLQFNEDSGLIIGDTSGTSGSSFFTQQTGASMTFNQITNGDINELMTLSGTNGIEGTKVTADEVVTPNVHSEVWKISMDGDMFSIDYIGD